MKRITKIEGNQIPGEKKKLRVAAYCRVSTASEEQLVSLAAQKAHYENYIRANDEWEFAGLYYDSVSIFQNSKWAVKKRFQNGTFVISYPPYGYDNVEGEMVVVPEQAQIVQRIFQDTLSGKSTHAISKELNEEGIRTKKGGG